MSLERLVPDEVISPELAQARAATAQIRNGLTDIWEGLAALCEIEGWRLMGYATFRRWAHEELGMSLQMADLHHRKVKRLMQFSREMGRTIAELAPTVSLRSGYRRGPSNMNLKHMRTAATVIAKMPALTSPDERRTAISMRNHLNRLLGEQ